MATNHSAAGEKENICFLNLIMQDNIGMFYYTWQVSLVIFLFYISRWWVHGADLNVFQLEIGSTSVRHVISPITYTTCRRLLFSPVLIEYRKNLLEELPKCNEITPGFWTNFKCLTTN